MVFHGFQKMTLLDFPGKVACTAFTGGCNLRCPFCHNALLVTEIDNSATIDGSEIIGFLKKRQGLLDGICITGGEPMLQNGLMDFICEIKQMGYAVKLDTNGSFPDKLKALVKENLLDYVAVDIKNSKEKYAQTVGVKDYDISAIEETVDFLLQGNVDFEFRTTVVKELHTVQDIEKICQWIKGAPRYFLQNFTDSGNVIGDNLHEVGKEEMFKMADISKKYIINTEVRGI
ncbi:MAG: anaerobic ribonucleoside-triphosphate reductase activating protein [Ruminococcus sp.]|nr:anaerobic ribonucleoside-triphosphate reductase activating protein [Candidatus Copronaster equi]